MKNFFTKRGVAILAVMAVIVIITAVSLNIAGSPGLVTNAGGAILRPINQLVLSLTDGLEDVYGYMFKYDQLEAENEALKAQIAEMEQAHREYKDVEDENERLRKLLELKTRNPNYTFDTATLISWGASNWSSTFTISKGSANSEVAVGDCVITESGGIVGVISEVGDTTSVCTSVIDTKFSASAEVESSGETAVAHGDFTLMRDGCLKLDYLEEDASLLTGDAVITSGKGGAFPQGLIVGYVSEFSDNDTGLGKYATVVPAVELNTVTNVYVVTNFELA